MTAATQTPRPLTADEATYQHFDRLWRHHSDLLREITPCFHGLGLNRQRNQDGCPRCYSNRVIDDCERRLNALGKVAA